MNDLLAKNILDTLPAFGRYALGKALGMRLDALPAVPVCFDAGEIDKDDFAAKAAALRDGLAQWRASSTRFSTIQELSRMIALVDESPNGQSFLVEGSTKANTMLMTRIDAASATIHTANATRSEVGQAGEISAAFSKAPGGQDLFLGMSHRPKERPILRVARAAFHKHMGALGSLAKSVEKTDEDGSDRHPRRSRHMESAIMMTMRFMESSQMRGMRGGMIFDDPSGYMRGMGPRGGFGGGFDTVEKFLRKLDRGQFDPESARKCEHLAQRGLSRSDFHDLPSEEAAAIFAMPLFATDFDSLESGKAKRRLEAISHGAGMHRFDRMPRHQIEAFSMNEARSESMALRDAAIGSQPKLDGRAAQEASSLDIEKDLLDMLDQASALAKARVEHWLASHGVDGLSELVRKQFESESAVDPASLLAALAAGRSRMSSGTPEGLIEALRCAAKGERSQVVFQLSQWNLHGDRLEAFAASKQAKSLCDLLLSGSALSKQAQAIATLACLDDFETGSPKNSNWASNAESLKAALDAASDSIKAASHRQLRSGPEADPRALASCLREAFVAMEPMHACEWIGSRFEEGARQLQELCAKTLREGAMPQLELQDSPTRARIGLPTLLAPWEREGEPLAGKAPRQKSAKAMLDSLGSSFCDEMARLAWTAGMRPDMLALGEGPHALENALLGQGKAAAKSWLGLTEAAWKGTRLAHASESEGLLRAAKHISAAARKSMEALDGAESLGDLKAQAGAAPETRIPQDVYNLAFGSGRGSSEAEAAIAGLVEWARCSWMESVGRIDSSGAHGGFEGGHSSRYIAAALSPLSHGAGIQETTQSLAQEHLARAERRASFELAALERAQALLKEELAKPARKSKLGSASTDKARATRKAGSLLAQELSDMSDWANDCPGNFWGQLPKKFGWGELRAGSARWHAESASRKQATGAGWSPIGLEWSEEKSGLRAQELCSPSELSEEGRAMRHCVGGYSDTCRAGSRIVSIRQGERRVATMQLEKSNGRWIQKQLKASCNSEPGKPAIAAAASILARANELAQALAQKEKEQGAALAEQGLAKALACKIESDGFDVDQALRSIQRLRASPGA